MEVREIVPRYPRAEDIAEALHVSLRTVRSWVAEGRIPCYRIGRSIFFRWEDLDQAMTTNRVEPWNTIGTGDRDIFASQREYDELQDLLAHDIHQEEEEPEAPWNRKPSRTIKPLASCRTTRRW